MQNVSNARWHRRKHWLHCIQLFASRAAGPDAAAASGTSEVAALLTDRRMTRIGGKLIASHIVGQAAALLSECCEWDQCPLGQPFGDSSHLVVESDEDYYDDESDDESDHGVVDDDEAEM